MSTRQRWLFATIIAVAALLRFTQLGSVPYGVNQDEAERAYEAYSLLQTGHDQHGHPWPLTFEAYSDKHDNASALSAYVALPFVKFLGPSVLAIRLPSAIAGLITVWALMLLARALTKDWRVAMVAGSALAVSPWHLVLSRIGHEAIWMPTLVILGALAFLVALERRPWWLLAAAAAWVIGFYGYGPAKAVFPLTAFALIVYAWRRIPWRHPAPYVAIGLALLLAIPILQVSFHQLGVGRFEEVSVFATGLGQGSITLFHNILSYSNPISWMQGKVSVGPIDWVIILIGIPFFFLLARASAIPKALRYFLASWLLIAVIPAILTTPNPNQLRASTLLGLGHIIGGWGLLLAWKPLQVRFRQPMARALSFGVVIAGVVAGLQFFWSPAYAMRTGFGRIAPDFTPAPAELVTYLETLPATSIWVVNDTLNQPQIFFMLFRPWNPDTLAADHEYAYNGDGWYLTTRLGRYHFCKRAQCPADKAGAVFVDVAPAATFGNQELKRIPVRGFPIPMHWFITANE